MEIGIKQASSKLGLSPRHVRMLAASGELPARRIGRYWAVDADHLEAVSRGGWGRPLSARSAWGVLELGEERLSRSERKRARQRRQEFKGLSPGRLAKRADVHRLVAHRSVLDRLADDGRLVLGGVSAAVEYGADLIAVDQFEAYVSSEDLKPLLKEYGLLSASAGLKANVLMRVPRPDWPFHEELHVAPPLVVAADLLDAGDERSVRAARALAE